MLLGIDISSHDVAAVLADADGAAWPTTLEPLFLRCALRWMPSLWQ